MQPSYSLPPQHKHKRFDLSLDKPKEGTNNNLTILISQFLINTRDVSTAVTRFIYKATLCYSLKPNTETLLCKARVDRSRVQSRLWYGCLCRVVLCTLKGSELTYFDCYRNRTQRLCCLRRVWIALEFNLGYGMVACVVLSFARLREVNLHISIAIETEHNGFAV
jgi:hypothetical protein